MQLPDWEEVLEEHKLQIVLIFIGIILVGVGVLVSGVIVNKSSKSVEIIEEAGDASKIIIEVAGSVENPGVYKLENNSRIEDAINAAGGISSDADSQWMEKYLNRAAMVSDGQKIYIPAVNEQSSETSATSNGLYQNGSSVLGAISGKSININTASQNQLESLWGIGPVTAQNIIEHRPYSTVEELSEKGIVKSNVYERNKDLLSVY